MPDVHSLVAQDVEGCIAQARFAEVGEDRVAVLALVGPGEAVDEVMDGADARLLWSRLRRRGWRRPKLATALSEQTLRRYVRSRLA